MKTRKYAPVHSCPSTSSGTSKAGLSSKTLPRVASSSRPTSSKRPTGHPVQMACHARARLCAVFVACCLAGSCAEQLGAPNPVPKVRRPVLRSAVQADSPATGSELSKPSLLLASASAATAPRPPAFQWAVLHNWLYFLSLGLSVPNLPRVISSIVNPDGSTGVSPASSIPRGARTLD